MINYHSLYTVMSWTALCACGLDQPPLETSAQDQAGTQMQGTQMQGTQMQGTQMQGTQMQGFRLDGATMDGAGLSNVRVERGELVAERDGVTLRGQALQGARLQAQVQDPSADPPATLLVEYRIADIIPEAAEYDPTSTGWTFLYELEQWVEDSGSWQPACLADTDGRRVAIPLTGTWDARGDRLESSSMFTFGCTTGAIAKCYRWGYRPWVTGYGDLVAMHWTCTRVARADYCGNGVSNTRDGTLINVWDTLPAPGPIQEREVLPPPGMLFEAGWDTRGAVCLSHARWSTLGSLISQQCPARLIPPGVGRLVCGSLSYGPRPAPSALMYSESYLNIDR